MSTPYIPFYTSDFLAGTSGMTAATKGVYITLLSLMYEAEKPLAQSWDTLARRCGCTLPAFKKAIQSLADDGKVEISDGGIWSDKCAKHITQRRERSDSAKAAAKKRWEKTEQNQGKADASAMRSVCYPEPEPELNIEEPKGSLSSGDDLNPAPIDEISEAVDAYKRTATRQGWPVLRTLSAKRRTSLKARLKEAGGLSGWLVAMEKGAASSFLNGGGRDGWLPDFDFFIKQEKFTKLMEGSYDDRPHQNRPRQNTAGAGQGASMASIVARSKAGFAN